MGARETNHIFQNMLRDNDSLSTLDNNLTTHNCNHDVAATFTGGGGTFLCHLQSFV